MSVRFRHIALCCAVALSATIVHAQSDVKSDVYVLDPSKAFKAQLVATSVMTGDVVITMPSLSGTMLLTGTAGAQGGMDRSTYLFNVQYTAGTGNALGAILTSTTPTTNASANGLDILATADGTGTATALKLRATGSTADNYALEIAAGGIKISSTLPTAVSSSQPLVLEGGVVKIGSVGTLTGAGTANTIPVWTGGSALGNSMLTQNGAGTLLTVGGREAITATTNQLVLGSTNTTTISATAPAASLIYTIADVGADAEFVMTEGAQTVNGVKTFGSAPNLSSLTARGVLTLDASKNVVSTALTNGQILIGSTGATPAAATLTAGSGITITNGAGTITVAATNPMPAGSVNNSTLRYDLPTTAWVENTSVLATSAGALTAVRATLQGTTNQLVLGVTNTTTITSPAPTAARTYTIPDAGANTEFVMAAGAQTINGIKTFGSAPNFSSLTASLPLKLDASKNVTSAAIDLTSSTEITGALPINRGGTNSATALNNNRMMVSSGGAIVEAAALTNGQLLIGSTGAAPVAAALTAGSGITVTNGAGTITIAATNPIPTGTTTDATLRYSGTAWVENTNVLSASGGALTLAATTNQLTLGAVAGPNTLITAPAPAASRTYTIPDAGSNASFVMTDGTQTIAGAKTFSSAVTITPTTNQLVLGVTRTVTINAVQPATASRIYTIPDAGAAASFVMTASTQTIGGAKTFSSAVAITPTTNQLVLGTTRTVTINAVQPATASRVYTIPDAGAAASFVMTESAQTINGVKTFGSAPNLSALTASGILGLDASKNITSTVLTNGQLLIGSTGAAPVAATLTAGSGITITPAAGSITIAATNPMPAGTTTDATLRYSGTAWVENTSVKATATGAVSAATLALSATSNQMVLGTTNTATISASAPSASRVYTIADPGANASFVMTEGAQTINGNKTISGTTNLSALTASLPLKLDGSKNITAAAIDLTSATEVTGALPINRGGTNSATALGNNRIMVSSGGAIVEAAALTNGQLLIGSTGAAPVAATLTAGSGITITPAAGSITIAATNPMPAGTTTDATLRYSGTAWVENTSVKATATGAISAATLALSATSNQMVLGTTNTATISASAPSASRVYTIADPGANASFMMTEGAQTINGAKSFGGVTSFSNSATAKAGNAIRFENPAGTFSSGFQAGAQTVNINYTLPTVAPTASQLLRANATTPTNLEWATIALLPTGTTSNSTLYWNGSAWTENTNVLSPSTGNMSVNTLAARSTTNQLVLGTTTTTTINATAPTGSAVYTIPDVGAAASFVMTAGAQTLAGIKTFSSGVPITATTNQLVLGTLNTATISASAPSASRVYTIADPGANASFVMTEGAQTVNGAKTLSSALTIAPTTNQLVLGTTNTVTINAAAPTASRVYTIPAMSNASSFVMTEGAGFSNYAVGDIIYASSANTLSKLPIGTAGQVLTVSGGVPVWTTPVGTVLLDRRTSALTETAAIGTFTTGLSVTGVANKVYTFDGVIDMNRTTDLTFDVRFTAPAGTTVIYSFVRVEQGAVTMNETLVNNFFGGTPAAGVNNAFNVNLPAAINNVYSNSGYDENGEDATALTYTLTASATRNRYMVKGLVIMGGTGGTVGLQFSKNGGAVGNNVTMNNGSYIILTQTN